VRTSDATETGQESSPRLFLKAGQSISSRATHRRHSRTGKLGVAEAPHLSTALSGKWTEPLTDDSRPARPGNGSERGKHQLTSAHQRGYFGLDPVAWPATMARRHEQQYPRCLGSGQQRDGLWMRRRTRDQPEGHHFGSDRRRVRPWKTSAGEGVGPALPAKAGIDRAGDQLGTIRVARLEPRSGAPRARSAYERVLQALEKYTVIDVAPGSCAASLFQAELADRPSGLSTYSDGSCRSSSL
jgi:hypothetical protein